MAEVPAIEVRHLTKRFPGVVALDDVAIRFQKGEFHAIVGENGAGKSTLTKILSGVITDFDGEFLLRGRPARFDSTRDAERAGISIIHQELNLVEQLSAAANILLGREKRTRLGLIDHRAMRSEAAALLEQLECTISPDDPVGRLRVGDQQLVEIAKALSLKADTLIMDEPTSALTELEVNRLFRVLERLLDRGVTVLYVSHKLDEVFRRSDRITVLRDGRLVQTLDRSATTPREVTHLMVGREIEQAERIGERTPGKKLLEVQELWLPWAGHARQWRLREINFSLHAGEVLGIAGLMGAGRTELLECLFGTAPERPVGRILVEGKPVDFLHPADARRNGIAFLSEDRKRLGLLAHMNVCDNITICTLSDATSAGLLRPQRQHRIAGDSIQQMRIRATGTDAAITSLSGGNQQKCIIARWLQTNPRILLLDDPTRGVDVGAKAEIYRIVDRVCRDGMGILVTSSELPELITLCDRIIVLCEGRLSGEFRRDQFNEQSIMEAATRQ